MPGADMSLSRLSRKTLQVSRGYTYTYYTSPASNSKPTLLLCHGWPDTAALYAGLINDHLLPQGYGIIVPDCLGYGGTDKPTEPKEYAWNLMAADLAEIVAKEGVDKVVSVGHDWGSAFAQRFYYHYPDRVIGLIVINVALMPPTGQTFDLDATNAATAAIFDGHGLFEYWNLFTAPDGSEIENANLESVYSVAFGDPYSWLDNWCTSGGMRKFLTEGRTQPTLEYAQGEHKQDFMERFSKDGGFEAPNCWYKAMRFNVQSESDKAVAKNAKVEVPFLFWGGEQDFVCRPAALQASVDAGLFTKGWKSKTRPGGHWALLERPEEFGSDLVEWLQETYS